MGDHTRLVALALMLATAGGIGAVIAGSAARGSFSTAGSTYRSAPDGARGVYLFAESMGLEVSRRHVDLEVIDDEAGTLVLLGIDGGRSCEAERPHGPSRGEEEDEDEDTSLRSPRTMWGKRSGTMSALECRTLLEWVERGGRLVHVTSTSDALLKALGIEVDAGGDDGSKARTLLPGQPSSLIAGVRAVKTPVAATIRPGDGGEKILLERETDSAAVAVSRSFGEGVVAAVSAPALATNRWLGEEDNAVFWASLLGELSMGDTVAFVEHHHGHADQRSILGYMLGRGLAPAAALVALILIVGVAAVRRLGRPVPIGHEKVRAHGDQLTAMSRIYQLGKHHRHAAERIAERAMAHASRLENDPRVAEALEALRDSMTRVRARVERGEDAERDLFEVARRASAVYDAVSRRRQAPPKAKHPTGGDIGATKRRRRSP